MASQGGYGLKAYIAGTVGGTATTAIVGIMDADFPEQERTVFDFTAHDSPDAYAEFVATGKRKLNPMSMTLKWDDLAASHAAILTAFASNVSTNFEIEDPLGQEKIFFAGQITKIGRVSKQDEGYTCKIEIQPTGKPTIS